MANKREDRRDRWYPHEINKWQGSAEVAALSDAGYRAFHNLIQYQWQRADGMIPDDERTLRIQSRLSAEKWEQCREEVLDMFDAMGNGKLANLTQYREWQRSQEHDEERVELARVAGKASAQARAQRKSNGRSTDVEKSTPEIQHAFNGRCDSVEKSATETQRESTTRQDKTTQDKTKQPEVAGDDKLGAVLLRIACAHPKSQEKGWTPDDVTSAAMHAVAMAVTREASAAQTSMLDAAHAVLALTLEISRLTPPHQVRYVPNVERFFHDSEYRSPADKWSGNGTQRSGAGRTKSDDNLAALHAATGGRLQGLDQSRAVHDGDGEAGIGWDAGPGVVLDGTHQLQPRGHRGGDARTHGDAAP